MFFGISKWQIWIWSINLQIISHESRNKMSTLNCKENVISSKLSTGHYMKVLCQNIAINPFIYVLWYYFYELKNRNNHKTICIMICLRVYVVCVCVHMSQLESTMNCCSEKNFIVWTVFYFWKTSNCLLIQNHIGTWIIIEKERERQR